MSSATKTTWKKIAPASGKQMDEWRNLSAKWRTSCGRVQVERYDADFWMAYRIIDGELQNDMSVAGGWTLRRCKDEVERMIAMGDV